MKDYSMYRYYKGEKENPFEAKIEELESKLPGSCNNYMADPVVKENEHEKCTSCRLFPCNTGKLSNAKMFWFYESCFEIEFSQKESSDWFSFFGGSDTKTGHKFMKLLSEEDYERPTEKKKAGVFDLWLNEYLFVDKLGPEYGENWYIKEYYSASAKELLQLSN